METTEPIAALEAAALEQLKRHGLVQPGDRVIAAVSGGADSMALLLFFLRCGPALGLTVEVAHVDHGLRGEASARDAAFVASFCRARGVPLHRFSAPEEGVVPPEGAGEAWARQLRYGFFERLCREHGAKLATAHTKNDQAETLLLHLARGCGPAGAAGIPAVRGAVIRPFLTVSRRQTEAYCRALGQPWVMDETNAADNYARNRVRRYALPALETVNPQAVEALARFCDRMALVDGYLAAQADTLLETAKQGSGWRLSTLNEAHPAVRDEAFARILGPNAREDAVARLAARKARKNGTKVIYTAHGFHFYKGAPWLNWLVYFPVEWLLSPLTDVLITINREDYERAKRLLRAKKVVYIPGVGIDVSRFRGNGEQGVALRRELGIPDGAAVLLSVGDLNKNKNHRAVLEALARMENRNLHYVVCGRGPLKEELEAFAREKGLADRVRFMGYRDDIPAFYAMADVFVFPSFREGLSVSVMEAMASGLPIVCSRIRGNTDMVEDGVNGYLMEPGNPDSIAGALRRLENREKREEISRNNLKKAEIYSLGVIAEQYRQL